MKISKFFVFFFFITINAYAAQLNLYVDKNVVSEEETVALTVEYDGSSKEKPDFSILQKDFRIVSNSSSQQFSYINGNLSQTKKWTLGLVPKRKGKISIPPLQLDGLISNSADIEVKELTNVAYIPDSRHNTNAPTFSIEQSYEPKTPYVQQQLLLLVNVYDSIGLQDGQISVSEEDKKEWQILSLLSNPIVRQETINNKRTNVETYAFALFPQKSGNLTLPQFTFDSYYTKNSSFGFPRISDDFMVFGMNFNNVFGEQVPVKMKTKQESVSVLPIPSSFNEKNWLPLSDLEISATWSVNKGFMVGEAVSRTIHLKAKGITKSMFPSVIFSDADGFKQYPENPTLSEEVNQGQLITSAEINNVYIPTKSGELTVPEIKIPWFNVNTSSVEYATIPAETILVLPNPLLEDKPKETFSDVVQTEKKPQPEKEKTSASEITNAKKTFPAIKHTILFAVALFFILLSLVYLFQRCKKRYKFRNAVIRSIKKHDYTATKNALILWANAKFYPSNVNNFRDISLLVNNKEFAEQLSLLNKLLYAQDADYFDIPKFIEILKKVDKIKVISKKNSDILPNLYD